MTRALVSLLARDLHLAFRRGGETLMPLFFLFAVIILVPLGLGPGPNLLRAIAPAVIWVAALLSCLLALDLLFRPDYEDGSLEQWWASKWPPCALVAVRLFSHWLITGVPIIVLSPLAAAMLYLPAEAVPALILSLSLGTPILSVLGGLAASLILGTNRGGVLLSILVFPLFVPVLIFATGAVAAAAEGQPAGTHLGLLAALLILAVTLAPPAITAALRLNLE